MAHPDSPATDVATDHDSAASVSFEAPERRAEDMRETVNTWLDELGAHVDDARASDAFQTWLDVQRRFHDYSYRNTLLIACQRPDATRVAGYRTWQDEFDRQVREGEDAIWIWAPIVARQCPECGHSQRYHDSIECGYDDTPPAAWSKGVVSFKPVPVFDVAQTEGPPLPSLETGATGDGDALLDRLLDVAVTWSATVRVVPADDWAHGSANGVCRWEGSADPAAQVEVRERADAAAVAGTLLHELAHARLHAGARAPDERPKREVEAEAVAYAVGRHFGLDTSNSAFYLAAWQDDDRDGLAERLGRIRTTVAEFIDRIEPD